MSSFRLLAAAATAVAALACSTASSPSPGGAPRPVSQPVRAPIAPSGDRATAVLHDVAGRRVGVVNLSETYAGVLVRGEVADLGLGGHGIHIHSVGKCEPPFASAGGHFNPEQRAHGFSNQHGHHLGDLPNIVTPAAGKLDFEFIVPGVTLKGPNALLDTDGSSIVVHATADDYLTDPAGNSGARIACGVIVAG